MECEFSMNTRNLGYGYQRLQEGALDLEDQKESSREGEFSSLTPDGFKLLKEKLVDRFKNPWSNFERES